MTSETYEAMLNRAMWYLGRRDYGTQELRQKLLRPRQNKPAPDVDTADAVTERLAELGLLDDARYAQYLAEALSRKGYSAHAIQFELRKRGIQEEAEAPVEDGERLSELLQTKYAARLGDDRGRQAVHQALIRKGYKHGDIQRAMRNYMEEDSFDGD